MAGRGGNVIRSTHLRARFRFPLLIVVFRTAYNVQELLYVNASQMH